MSNNPEQQLTFEDLMKGLEDCVAAIQEGSLSLDEASEIYQQGMDLAVEASKRLASQELSIKKITDDYEKAMSEIQRPSEAHPNVESE